MLGAGFCFFLGGIKYKTQKFSIMVNKAGCSLLFLACIALALPPGELAPEQLLAGLQAK